MNFSPTTILSFSSTAVWLPFFVLPYIIIGKGNRFDNRKKTRRRCAVSFFVLWIYAVIGSSLIYFLDLHLLPREEDAPIPIMEALFFGWADSAVQTLLAWLLLKTAQALYRFCLARRSPDNSGTQGTIISCTKTHSSDSTAI